MKKLLIAILLLLPTVSPATEAEETTTLAAPIARDIVCDEMRPIPNTVKPNGVSYDFYTHCFADLNPENPGKEAVPRTATHFSIQETETKVTGFAVDVGAKPTSCSATATNIRTWVANAVTGNITDDHVGYAVTMLMGACVGDLASAPISSSEPCVNVRHRDHGMSDGGYWVREDCWSPSEQKWLDNTSTRYEIGASGTNVTGFLVDQGGLPAQMNGQNVAKVRQYTRSAVQAGAVDYFARALKDIVKVHTGGS